MLPHIIVSSIRLVHKCDAFKATVGHVFLVRTPADFLIFQEVYYRRYIGRNGMEIIVVDAEVVASYGRDVVRFAGMSDGVVIRKSDAFLRQR